MPLMPLPLSQLTLIEDLASIKTDVAIKDAIVRRARQGYYADTWVAGFPENNAMPRLQLDADLRKLASYIAEPHKAKVERLIQLNVFGRYDD